MRTAVCVIVKNEAESILEWGIYHHLLGFDALIVFDDSSTDDTVRHVSCLRKICEVIQQPFVRKDNSQMIQYQRVCRDFSGQFDWIAFVDADEFIYSSQGQGIKELLQQNASSSSVVLPWLLYGSSGHVEKPDSLVMASYLHHAKHTFNPNRHVKSIVRPAMVTSCHNPHAFVVKGDTVLPDGQPVQWSETLGITAGAYGYANWRVNHYFTKSKAHWQARMARGQLSHIQRTEKHFEQYDRNDIRDEAVLDRVAMVAKIHRELSDDCMLSNHLRQIN
jgi:hypothetical protein